MTRTTTPSQQDRIDHARHLKVLDLTDLCRRKHILASEALYLEPAAWRILVELTGRKPADPSDTTKLMVIRRLQRAEDDVMAPEYAETTNGRVAESARTAAAMTAATTPADPFDGIAP